MKRIAIALLLLAAATIAYATRPVSGYTEQDIIRGDIWRIQITRASCPGPPPAPRACVVIQYSYQVRDENGDVRRQGTYDKELTGLSLSRYVQAIDGDLPEINTQEEM